MKIIFLNIFFLTTLFSDTTKVCMYTIENNIDDFKSLKVQFDRYIKKFGDYEFQAFSDKNSFEEYINENKSILILSSEHYKNLVKTNTFKAKLIAQKNNKIEDVKVLVGKKDKKIEGLITSAYNKKYTKKLLSSLKEKNVLSTLIVPKEIDALMSVGFGMSDFTVVSKDSFSNLQKINPFLTKELVVYKELASSYRILVAIRDLNKIDMHLFEDMDKDDVGKFILDAIGIDKFIAIDSKDLINLGGTK